MRVMPYIIDAMAGCIIANSSKYLVVNRQGIIPARLMLIRSSTTQTRAQWNASNIPGCQLCLMIFYFLVSDDCKKPYCANVPLLNPLRTSQFFIQSQVRYRWSIGPIWIITKNIVKHFTMVVKFIHSFHLFIHFDVTLYFSYCSNHWVTVK